MKDIRNALAEIIGTFALVFIGVGAAKVTDQLLPIALAFGLTIFFVASSLGNVSGAHLNPAVTIALLVTGKTKPPTAVIYILAQLIGASVGAFACNALIVGAGAAKPAADGVTALAPGISVGMGFALEFIATFFLVQTIFGSAVDPRGGGKWAPLAIGMTVTMDILFCGPLTGASMNPARSFGPALAAGRWANMWLYWVAPIAGAVAAALLYTNFFMKSDDAKS